MAEKQIGFDDPEELDNFLRVRIKQELKDVLREMGFRPSKENPDEWIRAEYNPESR